MSRIYDIESASFTNDYWIASKRVFQKPTLVNVEFLTAGDWDWLLADPTGATVKTLRYNGPAGWTSIHFASLGLYADYSIGFRSVSPGRKEVRGGDVTYG